ncbi:hypothetical protein ACIBBB_18235 [Streptomyces sp. NPDC051217]|uniref:hypothetical protein n=1 Tax=Streptomyces sp. NPDC051217 TaxID=3365644 RepID=UPI0037B89683
MTPLIGEFLVRSKRPLIAAVLAMVVAATVAPTATAAPKADGKYVAIGDSYAVAPGTRTYDNPDDPCRRGPPTYPRLWAAQHPSVGFVEASCSGATTADVVKIRGSCGILGLSDAERSAMNSAADVLNDIMASRAAEAGFTFLDPRPAFDPHALCSGGSEWVTSLEWDKINESYHPNVEGHRDGYLAALNSITG